MEQVCRGSGRRNPAGVSFVAAADGRRAGSFAKNCTGRLDGECTMEPGAGIAAGLPQATAWRLQQLPQPACSGGGVSGGRG